MSTTLYVPGRGAMDRTCRDIDLAVSEYDERLFAAKNPRNGLDTVFIKMSPFTDWLNDDGMDVAGQRCVPIMAFPEGFPHRDEVIARIYRADAVRRGDEILNEINKHNESLKEVSRRAASEQAGEVAEVSESMMHRLGKTRYSRNLPKRDPKQRRAK